MVLMELMIFVFQLQTRVVLKKINPSLPVGEDDRTVEIHKDSLRKQYQLLPYS